MLELVQEYNVKILEDHRLQVQGNTLTRIQTREGHQVISENQLLKIEWV